LAVCPDVAAAPVQLQPWVAGFDARAPAMHVVGVRELIEVAGRAGQHEAGGNSQRLAPGALAPARVVKETSLVRACGLLVLEAEHLRVDRAEFVTHRAAQPRGEGSGRYADARPRATRVAVQPFPPRRGA